MGKWSYKELEILRQYPEKGVRFVIEKTGRKVSSIKNKISKFGLYVNDSLKNHKWTENDIRILKEFYPIEGSRGVIGKINHPECSIRTKARRLNVKYTPSIAINKICTHCKAKKPMSDFSICKNAKSKKSSWCKKCNNEFLRNYVRSDKGKENYKIHRLKKRGLSIEKYESIFNEQNGVCAICEKHETALSYKGGKIRSLNIDHNHITGQIRGLLCTKCNQAIGLLKTDELNIELLLRAIEYIRKHNELSKIELPRLLG